MPVKNRNTGSGPWKLLLGGLFSLFLLAMAVTFVVAGRYVNSGVDRTYYRQDFSGIPVGWNITATTAGREFRAEVRDKTGAPVGGGIASFQPFASGKPELILTETVPGRYAITSPSLSEQETRGILHFRKGEAVHHQKVVVAFP